MKPFYEDDACTIYHGDCRELLQSVGDADAAVVVSTTRRNPTARLMPQRSWQPVLVYGDRWAVTRTDLYAAPTVKSTTVGHPCPKPDHFASWLVLRVTEGPGAVILDPFCGSGAFLNAAKSLGCKAIGIEIEERYCEIAAKRLAQEVLPL